MRLVWATATPPHTTPANSRAKDCNASLAAPVPDFAAARASPAIPCDRYSRDETIDLPVDEFR